MNADHADSLSLYLQHHHNIPAYRARRAQLSDISLNSLHLRLPHFLSYVFTVPIEPPLKDWAEARPRLVEMDREARRALGRSDLRLGKRGYRGPDRWWMWIWIAFLIAVFASFARRSNFQPESNFYRTLSLGLVPDFARFCYRVHPWLWGFVISVHAAEVCLLMVPRLRRYNVETAGRVWWCWVAATFFEGRTALIRFDDVVKEEEGKRKDH